MRILFGPDHDARHIQPDVPGGYEWWYFDAISDDARFTLVVIYFLGSPMSPYYKAVATGGKPTPDQWCGVFTSLHENVDGRLRERAYAYNLYRGGDFSDVHAGVSTGGSTLESRRSEAGAAAAWSLRVEEPCLWRGRVSVQIDFAASSTPLAAEAGVDEVADRSAVSTDDHTWVCVAPCCRVTGVVSPPGGEPIPFTGAGYHDHNFGALPFHGIDAWYWGRAHFAQGDIGAAVVYHVAAVTGVAADQTNVFLFDRQGRLLEAARPTARLTTPARNAYGFHHARVVEWRTMAGDTGSMAFEVGNGIFSEGPFYRRLPMQISLHPPTPKAPGISGLGIGEVFRPGGLSGPIASRAMWSRMRRGS